MAIKQLKIENFRNLRQLDIEPVDGFNVFTGSNGAGKTSILEAVAVIGRGRSFRTSRYKDCIQHQTNHFQVYLEIVADNNLHKLGFERRRASWRGRLDGNDVRQLSEIARLLPVTVFEPGTQQLVEGGPEQRRRYMDWGLFHVEQSYLSTWREHDRILRQRNMALKQKQNDRILNTLDKVLVPLAMRVHEARQRHVSALAGKWRKLIGNLAPMLADMEIELKPGWKRETTLARALEENLPQDRIMGNTRAGAHRDDLIIKIDGHKAQQVLSRGQQKLTALGLVLAQLDLWRDELIHQPVVLLDDLPSELDEEHSSRVLGWLAGLDLQIWISAVHWPEQFVEALKHHQTAMFHVEQGNVRRVL